MMHVLFWLSQAISVVLTAFIGVLLYAAGYTIGLTYKFIRWIGREVL